MKGGEKAKKRAPSWGGVGEREEKKAVEWGGGIKTTRTPTGRLGRKKESQDGEKRACVVAAARTGEGVPSWVSGGGCRPVTPGEGGACGAGRRQRGSGRAAARAAQSPGVARRGRGETYTGPPGPAQRRRRRLRTAPQSPGALALRPASLQVTLTAGGKLQEEGALETGAGTPVAPGV